MSSHGTKANITPKTVAVTGVGAIAKLGFVKNFDRRMLIVSTSDGTAKVYIRFEDITDTTTLRGVYHDFSISCFIKFPEYTGAISLIGGGGKNFFVMEY